MGKWWVKVPNIAEKARKGGYNDIRVAVVKRDWFCTASGNSHIIKKIQKAYKTIYSGLVEANIRHYLDVSYESVLLYRHTYINMVLTAFDLPMLKPRDVEIREGNSKYYKWLPKTLKKKKYANTSPFNDEDHAFDKMFL
jgi:hypothetical protein